MPDDIPLISTIAAALGLALIFGFLAVKLHLPALVGYLVAGVMIGPFTPGFVADAHLASQLAKIGVMLLMFGVGLHFSIDNLWSARNIVIPGAIIQILTATGLGVALTNFWGWDLNAGIIFGLALSVASTVVLLRALEDQGVSDSKNGQIAIGWLVVEDLVMVLALVLIPSLADLNPSHNSKIFSENPLIMTLLHTVGRVVVFALIMFVVGRRLFPWLLTKIDETGSRELFTLCIIAAAVGIAYGAAELFGVSFALGAFFAGMVLRESNFSLRATQESLPFRDAFSVLFFVSVGMLFDPQIIIQSPLQVLAVVAIIVVGKSLASFFLVLLFRYPFKTALIVSASLAQIGEFSFILVGLGVSLKMLPAQGQSLILAGALISIAINPLLFHCINLKKCLKD